MDSIDYIGTEKKLEALNPIVANFIDCHGGDELRSKLEEVYKTLEEASKTLNLTTLHGADSILLHFFDSFMLADTVDKYLTSGDSLCDVGCGAGFPSLPVAAALDIDVTALDSTEKKLVYVSACAKTAGIKLDTLCGRAEEIGEQRRMRFTACTARAVARTNVLCELCIPLIKVGGWFFAMKTDGTELQEAQNALKKLKSECIATRKYVLNGENQEYARCIYIIRKNADSPGYPRKFAKIKKEPL